MTKPTEFDHIDPVSSQLICGLDVAENYAEIPWKSNREKWNAFLPYRLPKGWRRHEVFGDWGWFLIQDKWVLTQFGSDEWWDEVWRVGFCLTNRPHRIEMCKDEFCHLYYEKEMSMKELAEHYGCSSSIILKRFKTFGLKPRRRHVTLKKVPSGARMKGKRWWCDGEKETKSFECPGPGFYNGRLKRRA